MAKVKIYAANAGAKRGFRQVNKNTQAPGNMLETARGVVAELEKLPPERLATITRVVIENPVAKANASGGFGLAFGDDDATPATAQNGGDAPAKGKGKGK